MIKMQSKFKETEIGSVPEEWDVFEFGKIAKLSKENYLPRNGVELCYIGLEHIEQQTLSLNSIGKSSKVTSVKSKFTEGDILFGKLRPYFRKVYRPNFSGICSTDIWVIQAKPGIDQGFLFYLIASEEFIKRASGGSGGTRMPRADWNHLKEELWPIPNNINEQKRIAEILGALDEMIELNQRINDTLEKIASAIFKHWFVDFDFPNEQGNPYKSSGGKMIESELGMIPKEWKVGKLQEIIQIQNGFAFKSEDYAKNGVPIVRTTNFTNRSITMDSPVYLTKKKAKEYENFYLNTFDFLLVMVGASIGKWVITPSHILPALQNQNMWNFKSKKDVTKFYNIELLKILVNQQANTASGSARDFFRKDHFYSLDVLIPNDKIVDIFERCVTEIFKKIDSNLSQIKNLSQIRDSLLHHLMSGKIRV